MVEISFMPRRLASDPSAIHPFSPQRLASEGLCQVGCTDAHLRGAPGRADGIDEVAQWYFEVWNEPNIVFWAGAPKQATYFELYGHTARDLKSVSPRLRVGGPQRQRLIGCQSSSTIARSTIYLSTLSPPTAMRMTLLRTSSTPMKMFPWMIACVAQSGEFTSRFWHRPHRSCR